MKKVRKAVKKAKKTTKKVVKAVKKVVDAVMDTLGCVGKVKTMAAIGYCKKWPNPLAVKGVGYSINAGSAENSEDLLKLPPRPKGQFNAGFSVVVGAVPGAPDTGGVRVGVGVGAKLKCSPQTCVAEISVGAVSSALFPTKRIA